MKLTKAKLPVLLLLTTLAVAGACRTTRTGPGIITEQQLSKIAVGQTVHELRAITGNPYSFADAASPPDASIWEFRVEPAATPDKPFLRVLVQGTPQRVEMFYRSERLEFADTLEHQ